MTRAVSVFVICLGLTLILTMGNLDAMPLSAGKGLAHVASADVFHKVHGCHHYCARGGAGWHRHGPRCGRHAC